FTWSKVELKAALPPDDLRLVSRAFGIGTDGRMPHDPDRNVLFRSMTDAEIAADTKSTETAVRKALDGALRALAEARGRRAPPLVDRTPYADINGLFLRAFARAARHLSEPSWLSTARRAADRFFREGYASEVGVTHRLGGANASGHGLLADQTLMALGLTELAGVTLEPKYVEAARALLDLVDREFSTDLGLYRDVAPRLYDGPNIGGVDAPAYPLEDTPNLSPNAAAAIALFRLASLTGDETLRERSVRLTAAMAARLGPAGLFAGGAAFAAGALEVAPARVVIEGKGPDADALARTAQRTYHPNLWVFRGAPPPPFSLPDELGFGRSGSRALICFGTRCLAPITEPAALAEAIRSGGRGPV
ncbi:MAG: hypothetical protein L3K01_04780, partial [Thermoplasmata archaeon]|nr:hypothetical protein [Thermoplasmata archaeon]